MLQLLNSAVYCIVAIWGQVRNWGRGVPVREALCRPVYRYGTSLQQRGAKLALFVAALRIPIQCRMQRHSQGKEQMLHKGSACGRGIAQARLQVRQQLAAASLLTRLSDIGALAEPVGGGLVSEGCTSVAAACGNQLPELLTSQCVAERPHALRH